MAKQVEVAQLEQMIKDFTITSKRSEMPEIRQLATRMLPLIKNLTSDLILYRKLTR